MKMNEPVAFNDADIAWAFPSVDPGAKPLGGRILVQLRRTKKKNHQVRDYPGRRDQGDREVEQHGGKVIRDRADWRSATVTPTKPWPEGSWCEVGDYIRVPKWGGDRWEVPKSRARKMAPRRSGAVHDPQ